MDGINLKNIPTQANNPRSNFDLSFKRSFDFKFGDLIPVLMLPVNPDDDISVSYEFLHRMAPFLSQVFQDYKVCFDFYYVPNQLVYHDFDLMMSSGYDGRTTRIHPYISPNKVISYTPNNLNYLHTIFDYFDISPTVFLAGGSASLAAERWNSIPFAAYIQAYLDHHIGVDTALNKLKEKIMSDEFILDDGDNTHNIIELFGKINQRNPDWVLPSNPNMNPATLFAPFKRLYPLDYFTSARSNPQLGPVMTIPVRLVNTDNDGTRTFKLTQDAQTSGSGSAALLMSQTSGSKDLKIWVNNPSNNTITVSGSVFNNVATINDFYSAARLQELLSLYNFSGFTPGDKLAAEYGVKNPDSRLHKAEWLHSSIHDVSVGEVFSSNVNNESASSANLDIPGSGTAVSATSQSDRGFKSHFTQFGYIVGLMSCYPEASYSQGIPRHFSISDRFDYPHYLLSEIGMAAIKKKEIFAAQVNASEWNDVFAYMSQYGDSKVGLNRINGNLRGNLRYMQDGRLFAGLANPNYVPTFNDEFLQVDPERNDLNRTFNVIGSYSHDCPMLSKISFNIYAKRQLPYYGLPRF